MHLGNITEAYWLANLYKKNASLMDYNTMGLKWQLSHFQLQGQVKLQRKKKGHQNLMGGTYGKKTGTKMDSN